MIQKVKLNWREMISQKWVWNGRWVPPTPLSWKSLCIAGMCSHIHIPSQIFFQCNFIFNFVMAKSSMFSVGNVFTSLIICFLQGQQRGAHNMLLLDQGQEITCCDFPQLMRKRNHLSSSSSLKSFKIWGLVFFQRPVWEMSTLLRVPGYLDWA